jgi:hypothetical protein
VRILVNVVMLVAIAAASVGAGLSVWENVGWIGVILAAGFIVVSVLNTRSKSSA